MWDYLALRHGRNSIHRTAGYVIRTSGGVGGGSRKASPYPDSMCYGGAVRSRRLVLGVAYWMLVPGVAFADAAIPTLALAWPGMLVVFVPVVAIEALVLARVLNVGAHRSAIVGTVANLLSTLAGIPLAYGVTTAGVLGVQRLPGASYLKSAAFLGHSTRVEGAVGLVVLLGAFFLVSWGVEYLVAVRMLRDERPGDVGRAVLIGNALSYALLAFIVVPLGLFVL